MVAILGACTRPVVGDSTADDTENDALDTGVIDAIPDAPDPPDGGIQIVTPTYRVEPYSEATYCAYGTFEGEGVRAIEYAALYEDLVFGHHIQFNGLREGADDEYEDGDVTACIQMEDAGSGEGSATTQLLSLTHPVEGGGEMILPDNYAVAVNGGDRWVLEYHIVNATDRAVESAGVVNLGFTDPDEVEGWVSAYNFNAVRFNLPAGDSSQVVVDCPWEQEAEILVLAGHMHDWGESFLVEAVYPDGTVENIYELDPWNPEWRYSPVVENFGGGITVPAGTTFRTTCSYFNTEDHDMNFPEEMCSTSGLFGPSNEPYACDVEL